MAGVEAFSGTETITLTEHSLTTDTAGPDTTTTAGIYQCFLDLSALASGDRYTFIVYEKVLSTSTQRVVFKATFSDAQSEPVWVSPTLILMHGWDMTLDKNTGTDRSIDWSIRTP